MRTRTLIFFLSFSGLLTLLIDLCHGFHAPSQLSRSMKFRVNTLNTKRAHRNIELLPLALLPEHLPPSKTFPIALSLMARPLTLRESELSSKNLSAFPHPPQASQQCQPL
ncbi:hypothetical protein BKA64DRAFT_687609 [Cadophora sp. MPI-SDFR-AT-0126]|nr:hypothetical protein BKA64DRAFT_687609 [Leotiomycetes sp. MPI-SDFR-AT-0126]